MFAKHALIAGMFTVASMFGGGCCCVDQCCGGPNAVDALFSCGGTGCGDCCYDSEPGYGPAGYLKHHASCGAGCGEVYVDEWISDPPDPCDPCDHCGNWTGPRCCPPRWWNTLWFGLWHGHRYTPHHCGPDCGCGGHYDVGHLDVPHDGEIIDEGTVIYDGPAPEVLPRPEPKPAMPQTRSALKPREASLRTPASRTPQVRKTTSNRVPR